MRLVYLDEAGTDFRSPVMCVAGVLVHGDREWPEVDRRISALIDKHIEPRHREGFVFHATDIFHGSRYFDRRKPEWASEEKRHDLLIELGQIMRDLQLPVVVGKYDRATFGDHSPELTFTENEKGRHMHQMAVVDCLTQTDKWLEKWAPSELATVVHEDGTPAKTLIKQTMRRLRSEEEMARSGISARLREEYNLPLKRVIDTVHFAEKPEARPLQLADLCAFVFARVLGGKPAPIPILVTILSASVMIDVLEAALTSPSGEEPSLDSTS